jgi:hypothetical protein
MREMYLDLVEELGDPEQVAREVDESVIRWHAARMPKHAAKDGWTTEEIDALQRAARAEAATYVAAG